MSAESYVDVTAILDVSKWSDQRRCLMCCMEVYQPVGLQYKPDLMALPFTGKNEKLLLIVFGHYNIILQTEFANFVANTKKSQA